MYVLYHFRVSSSSSSRSTLWGRDSYARRDSRYSSDGGDGGEDGPGGVSGSGGGRSRSSTIVSRESSRSNRFTLTTRNSSIRSGSTLSRNNSAFTTRSSGSLNTHDSSSNISPYDDAAFDSFSIDFGDDIPLRASRQQSRRGQQESQESHSRQQSRRGHQESQ